MTNPFEQAMEGDDEPPMGGNYIMRPDGTFYEEPNFLVFGRWYGDLANRVIAKDMVGGVEVSTIFLGMDHRGSRAKERGEPPVLFEETYPRRPNLALNFGHVFIRHITAMRRWNSAGSPCPANCSPSKGPP